MAQGELFILSAPSGAGKTTLIHRMFEAGVFDPGDLVFSVSHTTRSPRRGEVDGKDYHYVDRSAFETMVREGGFLEWAEVHGNLYGTSYGEITPRLEAGVDVVMDIDVQGAEQVIRRHSEAVSIFIMPPSYRVLSDRLHSRGLDDPADIARRLAVAASEIQCFDQYQYVIINDDADRASRSLASIILDKRHRLKRMCDRAQGVLDDFRRAG